MVQPETARRLSAAGLDPAKVVRLVREALAEDGDADVTSDSVIEEGARGSADIVARAPGVVAGLTVAEIVFRLVAAGSSSVGPSSAGSSSTGSFPAGPAPAGPSLACLAGSPEQSTEVAIGPAGDVTISYRVEDGTRVAAGDVLMTVTGLLRTLLRAERPALNLLTHLSGIATLTGQWADAVAGTGARVRDTRKTLPGLRALEKYAVRCGGGTNHRMSLASAALIKDNHVAAAGSVRAAFEAVRARHPDLPVQVECDTLDQVREALAAGAPAILLDNMTTAEMSAAVREGAAASATRPGGGRIEIEASGGLRLRDARAVAETGVDYLAVGALTHSAPALDIALDLRGGPATRIGPATER